MPRSMMPGRSPVTHGLIAALLFSVVHCSPSPDKRAAAKRPADATVPSTPDKPDSLAGTSWRLVKFQGGDETVLSRMILPSTQSHSAPTGG